MAIFKKLLDSFVEFPEEEKKPNAPKPSSEQNSSKGAISEANLTYQNSPELGQAQSTVNSTHMVEIQKRLEKVLEEENKKNFAGADYYEFMLALENMKDVPVESARYLSAFKVLSATQGLSREHLLQTAEAYINILDRELNEFNQGFEKENKDQVEDKEKLIETKNLQMQEFAKQISALNEEIKKLNQDLMDSKNRLITAKNSFLAAAQAQKEKIRGELSKIQNYIQ